MRKIFNKIHTLLIVFYTYLAAPSGGHVIDNTTRLDDQLSILLSHLPQKTLDKIPRWIKTNMVSDTC